MTAPAPTHLTTATSDADGTNYSTASVTPPADSLVLITTVTRNGGSSVQPNTPSGASIDTVSLVATITDALAGNERRVCVWKARGTGSAGAIAINHSASQSGCGWSVMYWSHASGQPEVVQSATLQDSSSPYGPITLAALRDADSRVYAGAASASGVTYTAGTGFTVQGQATSASPGGAVMSESGGNDTTVDFTTNYNEHTAFVAVEVGPPTLSGVVLLLQQALLLSRRG